MTHFRPRPATKIRFIRGEGKADSDEGAYNKSVRNMVAVLAAIVITAFAGVLIPPYLFPTHNSYQQAVSADSPVGFTMHLTLNATSVSRQGAIFITGWVNSTSPSVDNITASNSWGVSTSQLWTRPCTNGFPIGVGVMQGHYTEDNLSQGTFLPIPSPLFSCPISASAPQYFLLEPHSSKALVTVGGTPALWVIQTSLGFRFTSAGQVLPPGTYTAVFADEWGDILTSIFGVN